MNYFKYILIISTSIFFLLFGVHLLMAAYHLTDPFSFILTFFASNLIILISAALALGFVIRLKRLWQGAGVIDQETEEEAGHKAHHTGPE